MNKIEAIKKHLINARFKNRVIAQPDQIQSWPEEVSVEITHKKTSETSIIGARIKHKSVIGISPCVTPIEIIAVHTAIWLSENADKYDSQDFDISIDELTDSSNEIEIIFPMLVEEIELVESSTGDFQINGKSYTFGEKSLYIAEKFNLITMVDNQSCST